MTLASKKKPPAVVQRKRTGKHRSHGRNYLKPYWPYLPLLAVVGLGLIINSLWSHRPGVLGYATDMSAQTLLSDTNAQRANDHEAPLTLNSQLTAAAEAKAKDMATRNYWSHDTPDGRTPWSFITATGYNYQRAGENLAYGFSSASDTIAGWMNSAEHRANILDSYYSQVGFGIVNVPNYQGSGPETLVVAEYAEPAIAQTASAPVPTFKQTVPAISPSSAEPASQKVARIQLITSGAAPWSLFVVSTLAVIAALIFILRHGLFWRRALVKSEAFVVHHPFLDVAAVSIATAGILLSHTAGVIG